MRPQLRKLLKKFVDLHDFADWLGCTHAYARMMSSRGYLSKRYAKIAEEKTEGQFKASRLGKANG